MLRRAVRVFDTVRKRNYSVQPEPVKSRHGSKASIILTLLAGSGIAGYAYSQMLPEKIEQATVAPTDPGTIPVSESNVAPEEESVDIFTIKVNRDFLKEIMGIDAQPTVLEIPAAQTNEESSVSVPPSGTEVLAAQPTEDSSIPESPSEAPVVNGPYFSRRTKIIGAVVGIGIPVLAGTGYYITRVARSVTAPMYPQ